MHLTLKQKMLFIVLVVGIGLASVSSFILFELDKVFNKANYGNSNSVGSIIILTNARKAFNQTQLLVSSYISNSDPQKLIDIKKNIEKNRNIITTNLTSYETNGCLAATCISDEKDQNYLNQLKTLWQNISFEIDTLLTPQNKVNKIATNSQLSGERFYAQADQFNLVMQDIILYNAKLGNDSASEALLSKSQALVESILISILMLAIITVICLLLTRAVLRNLGGDPQQVTEIVKRVATGDLYLSQDVDKAPEDSLLGNIKKLVRNLDDLAVQTDLIGKGDFSKKVKILSEHDKLSLSINNMTALLQDAKINNDTSNWLKDGNGQLTSALTGDYSIEELADISAAILGRYLNAGRAVIYIYKDNDDALDLMGSYMYSEAAPRGSRFKLGEGAIGQVARERKPIILTTLDHDAAPIKTGTTSSKPLFTYTYPLLRDGALMGVVELASFIKFEPSELDFLSTACGIIASFLYIAGQRENIRTLLTKATTAEQDARQQSERLQFANTQMEEQQQQLQQQSEELRQANSQMEEQQLILEQNNQALKQSQLKLDLKAKDLENSGRYKSEFLANMSHELRTPLNAIILLSKIMSTNNDQSLSPEDVKRAEVILRSGKDLLALINDVLDLSKIEAGHMDIFYSEISTSAFSSYLHDLFSAQAEEKNIAFVIDNQLTTDFVSDHDKLAQILRNLLSNAFKFTKKGSVTLRLSRRPDHRLPICLSVIDTGVGIPKEKQEVIFEAFRQADGSTSREFGGTGLGLTISQSISTLLGGVIEIHSATNEGSTFSLYLPEKPVGWVAKVSNTQAAKLSSAAELQPLIDDRLQIKEGDKLILLIDDDPVFRLALLEINRRLGYKTILAENAAQGIAMARSYQPSGILLDLGLPDMDGALVLEKIKSSRDLASIPVYIVSARDHSAAKELTQSIGYLQKPANESQLIEAEATLLSFVHNTRAQSVLTICSGGISTADVKRLLTTYPDHDAMHLEEVHADKDISTITTERNWSIAIIDLTGITVQRGLEIALTTKQNHTDTALIFFSSDNLGESDEASLQRYSDCIIVNTPQSESRLQLNIERFLNQLKQIPAIKPINSGRDTHQKELAGHAILIVDDDPRNLFAVTAALEQHGAKVLCAINGRLALSILEKEGVDLILMDIMMPEMDGFEVIAAVRKNHLLADIPIVALTAKAMPQDKQRILDVGANDYLSKPVDFDDLINMSKKWVNRQGQR